MKLPVGYVPGSNGAVHKATAYGGFGQKMLEKLGWQKGQGLGKEKQGMREAIEAKKKEDTLGVGANESGWKWDWKYWEDAYKQGAQGVQSHGSDSSSDSSDSSDDDEPALGSIIHRDGTTSSATADELRIAKQLAKDPWGRFGGRDGKMARIRQQEERMAAEARAKMGLEASTSTAAAPASASGKSEKRKADTDASDAATGGGKGSKRSRKQAAAEAGQGRAEAAADSTKKSKKGKKAADQPASDSPAPPAGTSGRKVFVVQLPQQAASQAAPFQQTPAEGWWGCKMFASAGLLEGLDDEQKQPNERTTFTEADQEALYMRTQDMQRQGKRGMGRSSKLKIEGGSWQGTKKTFAEEGDEAPAAAGQLPAAEAEAQPAGASGAAGAGKRVKWAKLAIAVLKQAPGRSLRWKKLWKLVWAEAQAGAGEEAAYRDACWQKLQGSSKLSVSGKLVALSS